jgi:hypothetical protein
MLESELTKFFESKFNAQNYLFVWYYMVDYLDVDHSSDLGRFFMKSKSPDAY